jgi:mannose/fructose/N-acetylgalactosamine-specific phosphotransferase system component IIB
MDIALARVDDRLIHGQVVTAWLQAIGRCDEILICDDKTRNDQFLQQVLKLTAPPGKPLRVLSTEETIADFHEKADDPRRVLLLARSPGPMLRLLENGVALDHLNLGGMGGGPGRRVLHKAISVSDEELETLQQIQRKGVKVELRIVPSDRGVDLASVA